MADVDLHADRVYQLQDALSGRAGRSIAFRNRLVLPDHTNTIEGFFGNVKNGIAGNYHGVSRRWLQGYLNEFAWRLNHRDDRRADFLTLVLRSTGV